MKTDVAFYELVETNPAWLAELCNRPLPTFSGASSKTMKQTEEISADFVLEPKDPNDPYWTAEFQLYFDHSSINRAELARGMVWRSLNSITDCRLKAYQPTDVKGLIIFGDEDCLPPQAICHPEIEIFYLDKLIESLRKRNPNSPLLAVLAPLVDSTKKLEKRAAQYYSDIRNAKQLNPDEREVMEKIFIHFLTQIFTSLTTEQLHSMIAELTPIEETTIGKELIGKGREKGREEVLLLQIRSKFPDISCEQEEMVKSLNEDQSNKLAVAFLEFKTVADLDEWLSTI